MIKQPARAFAAPSSLTADVGRWPARTPAPEMLAQGIHVWRVDLDIREPFVEQLAGLLDGKELDRARRFHFEQDRRRYMTSHAALRLLLAKMTEVEAASVTFGFGPQGKPRLEGPAAAGDVRFNMAYSHDLALIAVTKTGEVGIDVERQRPIPDALELAARFFSPYEVAELQTVVGTEAEHLAFFSCWTRKEAIIKGLGNGLSYPLDQFVVSLLPGQPAQIRWDGSRNAALAAWSLMALEPVPGYVAALAMAGHGLPVFCWSFDWSSPRLLTSW